MGEVKLPKTEDEKIQSSSRESEVNESVGDPEKVSGEGSFPDLSLGGHDVNNEHVEKSATDEDEIMEDQRVETGTAEEKTVKSEQLNGYSDVSEKTHPGAHWDVFRRQDVPKLIEYLREHWTDFGRPDSVTNDFVSLIPSLFRHLSWFCYLHITDSSVLIAGDTSSLWGSSISQWGS